MRIIPALKLGVRVPNHGHVSSGLSIESAIKFVLSKRWVCTSSSGHTPFRSIAGKLRYAANTIQKKHVVLKPARHQTGAKVKHIHTVKQKIQAGINRAKDKQVSFRDQLSAVYQGQLKGNIRVRLLYCCVILSGSSWA